MANNSDAAPAKLSGYTWGGLLYQGAKTAVYRAVEEATGRSVVIKHLRPEYPSLGELTQFRNQYTITQKLSIPGVVKSLGLKPLGNRYALVMEDVGGISLKRYSQQHEFGLTEVLGIAFQLAEILHGLQQQRVIHKDIKPANILIHPDSKRVTLIDFSIASLLPKETQEIRNPSGLEGTLAYLSPEQTGRMNRGIDYRADFYALGVTLFELLTSQLPFESDDPMELVHCHIVQQPPLVHVLNPEVPPMVSLLVQKLMAKNAEDRYQSALGLKHDLLQCLTQWKETGEIQTFVLGEQDLCDRFLIPEKLYGRESEVDTLLEAFERVSQGSSELVLVAGFSGIGKTAVINEVHKPIVHRRGYFIQGKFDQFNRNIPFSAFVQAFRNLIGQILSESDTELARWRNKILRAVGENGQVLTDVIPELARVIGLQPKATELSGTAAQNRFNLLFQKFIAVFTTPEHPLVLFLDDLQWADSASLQLMKVLMAESDGECLLLLGAYRDNEVFPAHPLMMALGELEKQAATISTITLAPLSTSHINQLVLETLSCSSKLAQPLTELVYRKTKGNPFFTTQFLKGLYEDKLIAFDADLGYWNCDLVKVQEAALTDDVIAFMSSRLQKLPQATQNVLKLAACIGNQFELETLAIVCEASVETVAVTLWEVLQEGFILPETEDYKFFQTGDLGAKHSEPISVGYRFLHDRIQQAAYSLICEEDRQETHLKIGRLLWEKLSPEERRTQLFTIVNHYNQAKETVTQAAQKQRVIELNIAAGDRAKTSAAYETAGQYYQTALERLPSNSWEQHYPLSLRLHEANAEIAYLIGNFSEMELLMTAILTHAKTLLDQVKIHEIKIQSHMAQRQLLEALNTGIEFLNLLGIEVPASAEDIDLQTEISTISQAMEGKTIADIALLPLMEDPIQIAKINLLASLLPPCYQGKPELFPWIVCKLMQLSIQYGNTPQASFIYSNYGMLCVLVLQDFASAQAYGQLACQLDLSLKTGDGVGGTFVSGSCLTHYSSHIKESLPLLLNSYQAGLENGNFQFGGYALVNRSQYMYFAGDNLSEIKLEMAAASHALSRLKQGNTLAWSQTFEQAVLNLLGESDVLWELAGTAYDEHQSLPVQIAANDRTGLHYVYLNKLILCYLFDQIPQAIENSALAGAYLDGVVCFLDEFIYTFYDSLTQLAHYPQADTAGQQHILETVKVNQLAMARWANHAPMNAQHKYDLVAAEWHSVMGDRLQAIDLYDRAIAGAKSYGFGQEEALANERFAKFYLDWGREKEAAIYMQEAYYCYARWGARAKTDALEKRYSALLRPILQPSTVSSGMLNALMTITTSHLNTHHSASATPLNQALDFASIFQSSQALSGTIDLDELLHQLTQIILKNSGGDRCALLLADEKDDWWVRAQASASKTQLCSEPLTDHPHLPVKLLQYVKNTQQTVVINGLATDLPVIDDFLTQHQPQSILGLPILNQGHLLGILYLQNSLTSGTFTEERRLILNFLCTQAAISLENARLYQKAQRYAERLEETQLQIVQSEKMATLGNLVAGVAHEINNPIGFLNGSIKNGRDYVSDLFNYLEIYQQKQPPNDEMLDLAEELDLEFLQADLPKLLTSMKGATDRIKGISTSLRNFSRADTEHKVRANLQDGLNSTLLILKYRLKANENRPDLEVVKDYGKLPEIDCFPGQLNQVFMNILANAIDMFDEMAQRTTFAALSENPQKILITTAHRIEKKAVEIRIADNGKGMPDKVKSRIFDHLFTTKGVGKGTGLGLAIARQIVTEAHGGSLVVTSEVGQGTEFCIQLPL